VGKIILNNQNFNKMNLFKDLTKHINLDNPGFEKRTKIHDWRNYVPSEWIKDWDGLTEREKRIIAVMAVRQSDNEEWD
jgi:hypothetical protein